ncbi:MAG: MarR family winged helix-turn-helix transcriptional regulator [Methyloligellaceae bacterium]
MFKFDNFCVYLSMPGEGEKGATFAAEIILHLARLAHGDGHACGLTGAQWSALRYFSRANESSRTLLAFADFHVTTRGTASQTVTKLVKKGLLTRNPCERDARSSQIILTAEGRAVCANDPFGELAQEIENLSQGQLVELLKSLQQVMGRVVEDRQRRGFGMCSTCRHLGLCVEEEEDGALHVCLLTGLPLQSSEFDRLCMSYKPDAA